MQLFPPGTFAERHADFLPVEYAGGPTVAVRLDPKTTVPFALAFDGYWGLNCLSSPWLANWAVPRRGLRALDNGGTARIGYLSMQLPDARLGATELGPMSTMLPAVRTPETWYPDVGGLFGWSLLKEKFLLLLDLPADRVAFAPRP